MDSVMNRIEEGFDGVVEDSIKVREILSHPESLSSKDLDFIRARIGNNKTINVALNGRLSAIRMERDAASGEQDGKQPDKLA
jgi:hypothetical protein